MRRAPPSPSPRLIAPRRLALVALASALGLAACGLFSDREVGSPRADGTWRTPAKVALRPVEDDPGVLACAEPERHAFEGGARGTGAIERCGWRAHQRCVDECSLLLPCHLECRDETPPAQQIANAALYVRRLFAVAERCPEASVGAVRIDPDAARPLDPLRPPPPTRWRATGCDHRGRYRCEPGGDHPSGARCERLSFSDEALGELVDELAPAFAAALGPRAADPACTPRVVGGDAHPVALPDGRPGLALALTACGETRAYACVRPDLVPLGARACSDAAPPDGLVEAGADRVVARAKADLGCDLARSDVTLAREDLHAEARELVFRVRLCGPTRDVRAVRCQTTSLVDASLRGCWIDDAEADAKAAVREVGALLEAASPECREDRRAVIDLDARGETHLVVGRCYGRDTKPTYYRCANDYAAGRATCASDDATNRAAATLEAGARARFERDERCPGDKVTTLPIEGRPGRWIARAEGCGVTRDYRCAELAASIEGCDVRP